MMVKLIALFANPILHAGEMENVMFFWTLLIIVLMVGTAVPDTAKLLTAIALNVAQQKMKNVEEIAYVLKCFLWRRNNIIIVYLKVSRKIFSPNFIRLKLRSFKWYITAKSYKVLGLSNSTCPWTFVKTTTPINSSQ